MVGRMAEVIHDQWGAGMPALWCGQDRSRRGFGSDKNVIFHKDQQKKTPGNKAGKWGVCRQRMEKMSKKNNTFAPGGQRECPFDYVFWTAFRRLRTVFFRC